MNAFILALFAVLLAGIGARDQIAVAGLAARHGQRPALLCVAMGSAVATALAAAWLAIEIAPMLDGHARLLFAAMALAIAGIESLVLAPGRKPEEPTRSLGATGVVLLAHQLTDAARFLILAIAAATQTPLWAGAGGAVGGAIMLGSAWAAPELFDWRRLRPLRRGIGLLLLALALYAGLGAPGWP